MLLQVAAFATLFVAIVLALRRRVGMPRFVGTRSHAALHAAVVGTMWRWNLLLCACALGLVLAITGYGAVVGELLLQGAGLYLVIEVMFLMRRRLRRLEQELRRREWRACTGCCYDLRGLPKHGVCPECGLVYDVSEVRRYWEGNMALFGRLLRL